MDQVLCNVTWPSQIGRIPKSVIQQMTSNTKGSNVKADEWNRVRNILPVMLWMAMRNVNSDDIDGIGPIKSKRIQLFHAVLTLCSGLRTLLSRTITRREAKQAQLELSKAAVQLLHNGMPMTINWHLAMHYSQFISLYGPVGSYATWPYERNNGILARTRLFKGDIVQMTTTCMRKWVRQQLLAAVLDNPAPNASSNEQNLLRALRSHLAINNELAEGSPISTETNDGEAASNFTLPVPIKQLLNLQDVYGDIYEVVFNHLKKALPDIHWVDEYDLQEDGVTLPSRGHREYTHVRMKGFR